MAIQNNIKQLFSLAINSANGAELSQDDKELVELLAAVMANRSKFRVILEQTNPNTEALKTQINTLVQEHLESEGIDSNTISTMKDKIQNMEPQEFDKYLTAAQLTNTLKEYVKTIDLPIMPNMDAYVTNKVYVALANKVSALKGESMLFYDQEYNKNANAIKALTASMKLINTQMATISTEVTKNIDSLEQAHQDYNELLADNANNEDVDAVKALLKDAQDKINLRLGMLTDSLGSLRVQSNNIKTQLANVGDTSWQRTFTIYTSGTMPVTAPPDSIEIDSVDTYVKLFQLQDNQIHRCFVNIRTKAGYKEIDRDGAIAESDLNALPVINISKDFNIKAWQTGWGPIRAVNDYFLPLGYTNIKSMPDFSLRVERDSTSGKSFVWIKTNTSIIDTITIGEL